MLFEWSYYYYLWDYYSWWDLSLFVYDVVVVDDDDCFYVNASANKFLPRIYIWVNVK